jgi:Fe-S-cluster containining protein
MCCNGVLFYSARLGPEDSRRSISTLGLKIKRRADGLHLLQPCTAHTGSACSVYEHRPARCRLFSCRQLLGVESGKISEESAREKIGEARRLTAQVGAFLAEAGDSRLHKALTTRYETVFTVPLDPDLIAAREKLATAMTELEEFLTREFRVDHAAD